jgi:hypothetical protein
MTQPWAWSFGFKCYVALICDLHSLFHLTELFSPSLPGGDDNAKRFSVVWQNAAASLLSVWEVGCGDYTGGFDLVNQTVDLLRSEFPSSPYSELARWTAAEWTAVKAKTVALTVESGYRGVTEGGALSAAYLEECKRISRQQIADAGHAIASVLARIAVPVFDRQLYAKLPSRIGTADVAGWTALALLIGPAAISAYRLLRRAE